MPTRTIRWKRLIQIAGLALWPMVAFSAKATPDRFCVASCGSGPFRLTYKSNLTSLNILYQPEATAAEPLSLNNNITSTFTLIQPDGKKTYLTTSILTMICAPGMPGHPGPCGVTPVALSFGGIDLTAQLGRYSIVSSNPLVKSYTYEVVPFPQSELILPSPGEFQLISQAVTSDQNSVMATYRSGTAEAVVQVSIKESLASAIDYFFTGSQARFYPLVDRGGPTVVDQKSIGQESLFWVSGRYSLSVLMSKITPEVELAAANFVAAYLAKYPSSLSGPKFCIYRCEDRGISLTFRSGIKFFPLVPLTPSKMDPASLGEAASSRFTLTRPDGTKEILKWAAGQDALSFTDADLTSQMGSYRVSSTNPLFKGISYLIKASQLAFEGVHIKNYALRSVSSRGSQIQAGYQGLGANASRLMKIIVSFEDKPTTPDNSRATSVLRHGQRLRFEPSSARIFWVHEGIGTISVQGSGIETRIDAEAWAFIDRLLEQLPAR